MISRRFAALVALVATASLAGGAAASSVAAGSAPTGPSATYVGPHFGDGNVPAGCIVDRDPMNPDNLCYHMKVGLNALDTPKVDVDVVVPVSPAAERDLRMAEQAVMMWKGGIDYLAGQMDLGWLEDGFDMNIRTHQVLVDPTGTLAQPVDLVDPEIVVVLSNPAGGIGIGVDPINLISQLGVTNGEGVPCTSVPKGLTTMKAWKKAGFQQHGGEQGGIYVEDCGGVGGNVCFAVNGAVDPVPGASDFFPVFDLVSHEFGHCLTLGHVGDGADGPWGPTPTNDIMAYSTDPPGLAKCVSTLDVEGFALRMSNYLDVNGDRKVDAKDKLLPNDVEGDAANSFQVQNPDDHYYASSTGSPQQCPQPSYSLVPGSYGDWDPKPVATTRPTIQGAKLTERNGRLTVSGTARNVALGKPVTARTKAVEDPASDSITPITDITGVKVKVTRTAVDATMSVSQLFPVAKAGSVTAYSLQVSGRRFDSFIGTGQTSGPPMVMDNGTGYYLPQGTARWNYADDTVTFHVRRDYLADQHIYAPYTIFGQTGLHARSNDWIATTDSAPDSLGMAVTGPRMGRETRDAPVARTARTTTTKLPGGTFVPTDSTLGVGLVSTVDNRDYLSMPIKQQSKVQVTLSWDDPASSLALLVNGGSGSTTKQGDGSVTVTVPWARRDLSLTVDPQQVSGPVTYTLKATTTSVIKDKDGDHVPDVADACKAAAGPSTGGGCPDTDGDGLFDKRDRCAQAASVSATGCPTNADERVVLYVDGRAVATQTVVTRHGSDEFRLGAPMPRGAGHRVVLAWVRDGKVVGRFSRTT